jgi:selenium metabolism protein YedF
MEKEVGMKEIDARGLACPAPVLETKAVVENDQPAGIRVLVDNPAARENVARFLSSRGYVINTGQQGKDLFVVGTCGEKERTAPLPVPDLKTASKKIMVIAATDRFGFGDDELGLKLMVNFIKTLKEMGPELWRLVFINNGVKLTVAGSEILPVLKEYEEHDGVTILVCGTCLTHFNLLDQKQVGETTNMLDIVTAMQLADKVISL